SSGGDGDVCDRADRAAIGYREIDGIAVGGILGGDFLGGEQRGGDSDFVGCGVLRDVLRVFLLDRRVAAAAVDRDGRTEVLHRAVGDVSAWVRSAGTKCGVSSDCGGDRVGEGTEASMEHRVDVSGIGGVYGASFLGGAASGGGAVQVVLG